MILKVAHNFRLNSDANVSITIELVVDGEDEARAAGRKAAGVIQAYLEGFGEAGQDR